MFSIAKRCHKMAPTQYWYFSTSHCFGPYERSSSPHFNIYSPLLTKYHTMAPKHFFWIRQGFAATLWQLGAFQKDHKKSQLVARQCKMTNTFSVFRNLLSSSRQTWSAALVRALPWEQPGWSSGREVRPGQR